MSFAVFILLLIASVHADYEINIDDPPPEEENQGEWCLIPSEDGILYRVNTAEALSEPIPPFSPRFEVRYELFTLNNTDTPQLLDQFDLDSIRNSNFDRNRPTRFVTHGWRAGGSLTRLFADTFLVEGKFDINLIIVDWGAGANTFNYITASRRVANVGRFTAQLIDILNHEVGLNFDTTHLIGHSLGAHVSGFAGKNVQNGKIRKIVALDPAAPLFNYNNPDERVAVGDAEIVESIHTNAGTLGFSHPIGDASFYPNGGRSQPGCGWDLTGACAHARSYYFLAESIKSDKAFRTYQCESFDQIRRGKCSIHNSRVALGGEPGNLGAATGVFYLRTNAQSPFILTEPIEA